MNALQLLEKRFPSPTGVNYYEYEYANLIIGSWKNVFPSPTGVNYYESKKSSCKKTKIELSFRPQQGLTIMNTKKNVHEKSKLLFPSPTGVNYYEYKNSNGL